MIQIQNHHRKTNNLYLKYRMMMKMILITKIQEKIIKIKTILITITLTITIIILQPHDFLSDNYDII